MKIADKIIPVRNEILYEKLEEELEYLKRENYFLKKISLAICNLSRLKEILQIICEAFLFREEDVACLSYQYNAENNNIILRSYALNNIQYINRINVEEIIQTYMDCPYSLDKTGYSFISTILYSDTIYNSKFWLFGKPWGECNT